MANFPVKLWKALEELKDDEFKKFKWFLKQDNISAAQLEKADRQDTVDLMAQKYGGNGAVKETMTVLEKISRIDLVQGLKNSCLSSKDLRPTDFGALKDDHERKQAELKGAQQFAVDVTLDPNFTRPGDREHVRCGDVRRTLLLNPEIIYRCVCWNGQRVDQKEETNHNKS
ncbi:uncharacterized protein LOC125883243 isoform X2 [Epinephelus fuscoguttatus]|nr:uncharacterized protein LOC125883243 isoform X2 [Epinephelus fuscoguttatus]